MSDSSSVTLWAEKLRDGDTEGAQKLWECFFARMVALARHRLRGAARQMADEEDVALSAFLSFCEGLPRERFPRVDSREDVWQILVMLTVQKANRLRRDQQRLKRGGKPSEDKSGSAKDACPPIEEIVGAEPDPALVALFSEELQARLQALPDDQIRQIVQLKLEGCTNPEIAVKIDSTLRTVERRLQVIRRVWQSEAIGDT